MCFLKGRTSDRHQPSHQVHSPQPLPQSLSPPPSPPLPSPPLPSPPHPSPPFPTPPLPFFPISLPSAMATTPSSGLSLSLCICQVLEFSDRGRSSSRSWHHRLLGLPHRGTAMGGKMVTDKREPFSFRPESRASHNSRCPPLSPPLPPFSPLPTSCTSVCA